MEKIRVIFPPTSHSHKYFLGLLSSEEVLNPTLILNNNSYFWEAALAAGVPVAHNSEGSSKYSLNP